MTKAKKRVDFSLLHVGGKNIYDKFEVPDLFKSKQDRVNFHQGKKVIVTFGNIRPNCIGPYGGECTTKRKLTFEITERRLLWLSKIIQLTRLQTARVSSAASRVCTPDCIVTMTY